MSIRHTPAIKRDIASKLKTYRLKHNMSQEELARLLSSSVFSISRWETAKNYPTSSAIKLMKISGVL